MSDYFQYSFENCSLESENSVFIFIGSKSVLEIFSNFSDIAKCVLIPFSNV